VEIIGVYEFMFNYSPSPDFRKPRLEWYELRKKAEREKTIHRPYLNQLALDLAEEWCGTTLEIRQHLCID
jgi:hypothetical protein